MSTKPPWFASHTQSARSVFANTRNAISMLAIVRKVKLSRTFGCIARRPGRVKYQRTLERIALCVRVFFNSPSRVVAICSDCHDGARHEGIKDG